MFKDREESQLNDRRKTETHKINRSVKNLSSKPGGDVVEVQREPNGKFFRDKKHDIDTFDQQKKADLRKSLGLAPKGTGADLKSSTLVDKFASFVNESIARKIKQSANKIQDLLTIKVKKISEEDEEKRMKKIRGEWYRLTFKYIINVIILWGLTYFFILVQNLDWDYFYRAIVFDVVLTFFAVGLLNVISTAIINQRNVEYSISARRMIEKRNLTRYYIKIVYPIVVYILYLGIRLFISYNGYDREYTYVKGLKIFFGWFLWVLIFFVIKIFSKEEQKNEDEEEDALDDRVKAAMEKFLSYQKDTVHRNKYLNSLKNKLVNQESHLSSGIQRYHKNLIMKMRFDYIEEGITDELDSQTKFGNVAAQLNNSRNFADKLLKKKKRKSFRRAASSGIFNLVKDFNKSKLEKEKKRKMKSFTGDQFLGGAIFSLFPMIQNLIYIMFQIFYNDFTSIFWWMFCLFFFFMTPFIFSSVANRLNKSYKFQHSMYIILSLETSQFLHLNFLIRVPKNIDFNIYVYYVIFFSLLLLTRLIFNVPAIRLYFVLKKKKAALKQRTGINFAQEEGNEEKIKKFLKELIALNYGISYVFIYVLTSFTILGCIMIVHWSDFSGKMGGVMPEKNTSILYFGMLFFFMIIFFVYNLNWIKRKVKKERIEEINIDESSIIFLNHNYAIFNFLTIWFVLNFIYVY